MAFSLKLKFLQKGSSLYIFSMFLLKYFRPKPGFLKHFDHVFGVLLLVFFTIAEHPKQV